MCYREGVKHTKPLISQTLMLLHGANHLSTSLTLLISKKPGSRMNPTIQIPLWAQPQKQIKSCNPFSKRTQAGFVFQFYSLYDT